MKERKNEKTDYLLKRAIFDFYSCIDKLYESLPKISKKLATIQLFLEDYYGISR